MMTQEDFQKWLQEEAEKAKLRLEKAVEMVANPPRVQIGMTPHDVVYRENKLRVLHYHQTAEKVYPVPLLIVPALINRYYILDLKPGRSLVEYLLGRGIDVYMLDWGIPDDADRLLSFDHYITTYLHNVVGKIMERSRTERISLLGYCMGGTMTTIYTALRPKPVKNLITLAAPVSFHDEGLLSLWTRKEYFNVDKLVDAFGNVPPELIQSTFLMLRPTGQISKMFTFFEKMYDEEFVDLFLAMETWVTDNIPFPGEAFKKYVKNCYQENLLCQNRMTISDRLVDLRKITCPLLIVVAEKDHICPPGSGTILRELVSSQDKEVIVLPGGHVGIVTGSGALKYLWPTVGDWLVARSE